MNTRLRPGRPGASGVVLAIGAIVVLAAVTTAGCSKNTGSGSAANSAPMAAAGTDGKAAGAAGAPAQDQAKSGGKTGGTQAAAQLALQERSLIRTGTIGVTVDDVAAAADRAAAIAEAAGGLVAADKRSLDGSRSQAQMTVRVPGDKFEATLDELSGLGTEQSRSTQVDDVTQAVVDLDTRIASQQASVDRVRTLMAKANTIGEVVSIESELSKREADLASLQAQKRSLAGQVALSTITVMLYGPQVPPPVPASSGTGFLAGLSSGWHAFIVSAQALLTVLGALLPFALAIGVPAWLVLWLVRRRRTTPSPS